MKQDNIILFTIALLLTSCNFTERTEEKSEHTGNNDKALVLQAFNDLPEEIDGCSSLISENSTALRNHEYLYADNLQNIGYINIDGEMIKLTLDESDNNSDKEIITTGRNEDFEVKLDIRKSDQLDYQGSYFGTLEVRTKDGRKYKRTVFGECGC